MPVNLVSPWAFERGNWLWCLAPVNGGRTCVLQLLALSCMTWFSELGWVVGSDNRNGYKADLMSPA